MKTHKRVVLALLVTFAVSADMNAQGASAERTGRPPEWWEVAAGILAIPTAIIGLAYSYVLVGKTRLEARKTELEIREKEAQLRKLSPQEQDTAARIVAPFAQTHLSQLLVLRFVLLYIVLTAWGLIENIFDVAFTGAMVTAQNLFRVDLDNPAVVIPAVLIQQLPKVGYWILFIALALPLFKDVNALVGLDVRRLFGLRRPSQS